VKNWPSETRTEREHQVKAGQQKSKFVKINKNWCWGLCSHPNPMTEKSSKILFAKTKAQFEATG